MHASWQMDDRPNIVNNPKIQITELTLDQIWQTMQAEPGSGGFYRPIACLTLGFNWFFGKDDVYGYHLINLLIHITTSWLLFLAIRKLFNSPRLKDKFEENEIFFISVTATLLWPLNPVQTQAVTYIVQRMASLAALFSLGAILCYLRARTSKSIPRRNSFFILSAISFLLAILSKENSILLLLTIPIFEAFFLQSAISTERIKKLILSLIVCIIVCALIVLAIQPAVFEVIDKYYLLRPYTMWERILTEQRILLFYLSQLFFPHPARLSIAHDFPVSTSLFTPWETTAAITINFFLIGLAIFKGRQYPFLGLAILFFYCNQIAESTIIPLELVFEHRNYLPSLFLFIPIALIIHRIYIILGTNRIAFISFTLIFSLILTTEGYATYYRNSFWQSEQSLWLDAQQKAPETDRPLAVLALQLGWGKQANEQDYRRALELINRSLILTKQRKYANAAQLGNAASLYFKLGEHETSIRLYREALQMLPNDTLTLYNMAKAYIGTGQFQTAKNIIDSLVAQGYSHPDYFHFIGLCNLWLGKPAEALNTLRQALSLAPFRPDILLAIGKSMSMQGYHKHARWFLDMARQQGGESPIVSAALIENCLLQKSEKCAQAYLDHSLDYHSLPSLLQVSRAEKPNYMTIPIDSNLSYPFITKAIQARLVDQSTD